MLWKFFSSHLKFVHLTQAGKQGEDFFGVVVRQALRMPLRVVFLWRARVSVVDLAVSLQAAVPLLAQALSTMHSNLAGMGGGRGISGFGSVSGVLPAPPHFG